jgi:hypothetical protein
MRDGVCASRGALAAGPRTTVLGLLRRRLPRVEDWAEPFSRSNGGWTHSEHGEAAAIRAVLTPRQPAQ